MCVEALWPNVHRRQEIGLVSRRIGAMWMEELGRVAGSG